MIQFDEYGNRNNPTILLLHGAGALDTFTRQYCFANKFHLVVPHLPGAGENAHIPYLPAETISLLHELIKSLHKENIGVVGHSLGAQIAIMLVTRYPQHFSFAVFLSAWVNPKASECLGEPKGSNHTNVYKIFQTHSNDVSMVMAHPPAG